jgi:hypothetical protein
MTKPHGQEKERSRDNRRRVREILRTRWDPIGVGQDAPDEYDRYADRAYVMIMYEGAGVQDVAAYLHHIATDYIGLTGTPYRRSEDAARAILALRPEFLRPTQ